VNADVVAGASHPAANRKVNHRQTNSRSSTTRPLLEQGIRAEPFTGAVVSGRPVEPMRFAGDFAYRCDSQPVPGLCCSYSVGDLQFNDLHHDLDGSVWQVARGIMVRRSKRRPRGVAAAPPDRRASHSGAPPREVVAVAGRRARIGVGRCDSCPNPCPNGRFGAFLAWPANPGRAARLPETAGEFLMAPFLTLPNPYAPVPGPRENLMAGPALRPSAH
jgi:hypothetical protein